ncbi:hypothetical protein HUN27_14595 [Agrobacterium tumefaciens]|nr:hypothetical protein [Agrobacterium tumefaciens]
MPGVAYWNSMLELHLRRANGNAFQDFVARFLGAIHGDDFVPIKTQGKKGDEGLDGFLLSGGVMFQCYGAENGRNKKSSNVETKMLADYAKAVKAGSLTEWKFTHNMISGLTTGMLKVFKSLVERGKTDGVDVKLFGIEGFKRALSEMPEDKKIELLGFVEAEQVDLELLPAALEELISELASKFALSMDGATTNWVISENKLEYNAIPGSWQHKLRSYYQFSEVVTELVSGYNDGEGVNAISEGFRNIYLQLDLQDLTPSEILFDIHEKIMGSVTARSNEYRDIAALALMATMFETCVIFKDVPKVERVPEPTS